MVTFRLMMLAVFFALISSGANAEEESGLYGEVQLTYYKSRNTEADSIFGKQLYAEYSIADTWSVWGSLSHDREFRAGYAGLVKQFGNLSVALGVGSAWYDDVRHTVLNPWAFYENDQWEAFITAEHYSRDEEAPWWYKGYAQRKFGSFFAGVYGEKFVGVGPKLGWVFHEKVKAWLVMPMASQPDEGRTKVILGLEIVF